VPRNILRVVLLAAAGLLAVAASVLREKRLTVDVTTSRSRTRSRRWTRQLVPPLSPGWRPTRERRSKVVSALDLM